VPEAVAHDAQSSEGRLRRLLDRQEILDCVHRYARGVDRHDHELIVSAYHPDAVHTRGEFSGTPAEFVNWVHERHQHRSLRHQHHITTHNVEFVDDNLAYAETYFIASSVQLSGGQLTLVGGRYVDRFERRDSVWRIADRVALPEWQCAEGLEELHETQAERDAITWDRSDLSYRRIARPRVNI